MARLAKGERREELVVEAAARAISELGVGNVRIQDIAERADMRPGHVSYYFPSKDTLLQLAIRRSEQLFIDRSRAALAEIADPSERLRELIAVASAKGPRDEGWMLWLQVWASGVSDEPLTEEHQGLDQRWFDLLVEVIEYGQAQGAFHAENVADAAEIISGLIDGLSVQVTIGTGRVDRDRLLQLCAITCERLLGA